MHRSEDDNQEDPPRPSDRPKKGAFAQIHTMYATENMRLTSRDIEEVWFHPAWLRREKRTASVPTFARKSRGWKGAHAFMYALTTTFHDHSALPESLGYLFVLSPFHELPCLQASTMHEQINAWFRKYNLHADQNITLRSIAIHVSVPSKCCEHERESTLANHCIVRFLKKIQVGANVTAPPSCFVINTHPFSGQSAWAIRATGTRICSFPKKPKSGHEQGRARHDGPELQAKVKQHQLGSANRHSRTQ